MPVPRHASRPTLVYCLCAVLFMSLFPGGCSEDASPPVQASLLLLGEARFTGTINGPLTRDLQVLVVDQNDEPVPGVVVNFVVSSGRPLQITPKDTTDAMGLAGAEVILGDVPGETLVLAIAPGLIGSPLPLTIETTPYLLRLSGPQDEQVPVCEPLENPVMALLADGQGNRIAGAEIIFTPVHGSVSDSLVVTGEDGRAYTEWTLGPWPGYQVLNASHGASEATLGVEAIPGPPHHLVKISGDRQMVRWDEEIPEPLMVRLVDRCENPLPGVRLNVSLTEGDGYIWKKREITDEAGLAWTSFVPKTTALVHRIAFSGSGAPAVEFTVRTHAPVSLQTTEVMPTAVHLSWDEILDPEVRGIDVFRSGSSQDIGVRIASLPDPTVREFTDTQVTPLHTYYYRLRVQLEDDFQFTSAAHPVRIGGEFQVPDFRDTGFELHLDGSRNLLYVSTDAGDVAVVSPETMRIEDRVDLGPVGSVGGMASDAGFLLVATSSPDRLHVVNPDTRAVERSVDVQSAWDVAALPQAWVVISPAGSGNLQMVRWEDPTDFKLVNTGLFISAQAWLEVSDDASTLYVLDGDSYGRLLALDVRTHAALKLRDGVVGAAGRGRFAVHGDRILLTDGRYLNAFNFALLHDFDRTGIPVISRDGTRGYLGSENGIVELDLQSLTVRRTMTQEQPVSHMVLNAEGTGLWLVGPRDLRLLFFP